MSNVPTNLIPSTITQLPEYQGTSTAGYFAYSLGGRSYKVQFGQLAAVGAVPSSRVVAAGTGLTGGGDLSENRVISIANGGVGTAQLADSGVVAGVYGSGSEIPVLTIDATGRVTTATTSPLTITGYVPDSRTVTAGTGLLGGGNLSANRTFSVDFYASAPQALGSASAGTSNAAARGDHVHPAVDLSDTDQTQGALPLGRGGTGDALSPVAGAVVYSTGTKLALADPGIAGQVLTSAGTGEPYWQTISGTGTVTSVDLTAGTGISVSGGPITTSGSITVTNTAPDQVVSLTAGSNVTITGTYPNFTIAASGGGGSGTVTSVAASGGTTGLTFSGSPITTSGTLTLGGTLAVASGGTGATDAATARANLSAAKSGANSDITSMSGVTGGISTPDYIDFDTGATVTRATGRLWWDSADGIQTLNLGMAGSNATLQVGEEMYFRVKASSAITEGQVVMFTGTVGASGGLTAAPATGLTKDTASYIMGVATEDIALNGWGYVTQFGLVRSIDTTGGAEAWVDGQILYYNPSVAGGLTKTVPTAPAAKVEVAAVVYAAANGSLFIRPNFRFALGQLNDVETAAAANGDLLQYNGTGGYWEHKIPSTISVGTATNLAGGAANRIAYQTGSGATGFITAPSVSNTYLEWSGSAFQWSANPLGTVTSVAMTVPTGLTVSGSPITTSGTLAVGLQTGYSIPTTASQANWDTAYSERLQWDGGSTNLVAATGRTSLGATTVGGNFFTLTNPSAITFPRINADNTVSALSASDFRTAIGAGTGSGSVTSVDVSGGTTGLTFSGGPVTSSGTITAAGTLAVANGGTGVTTSTGTGSVVLSNSPTLVTPTLGAASATSVAADLGAAATPSYTFTGDTDTGVFSPSANTVAVATVGSERMRVTSAGDVLIGTTTAGEKLTVAGSVRANSYLINTTQTFSYFGYLNGDARIQAYNSTGSGGITNTLLFDTANTERMRIDGSGVVSISGTTLTVGGSNVAVGLQTTGQQVISTSTALTSSSNAGSNILVVTSGITLTLPTSAISGKAITISNISGGNITLSYTGSSGTDGPTTMAAGTSLMLVSDGGSPPYWRLTLPFGAFDGTTLYEAGYKGLPQNSQTSSYTLALTDQGKHISITTGGVVIPANGSVAFPIGTTIVVFNNSGSTQTISITTDTLRQAGTTNTGSRTLAVYGLATLVKVASTTWVVTGNVT